MPKNTMTEALSKRLAAQTDSIETSYDEMFGIQNDTEKIVSLDIRLLVPHPDDPFKHYSEAKLRELAESISKVGLLEPVIVRPAEGNSLRQEPHECCQEKRGEENQGDCERRRRY